MGHLEASSTGLRPPHARTHGGSPVPVALNKESKSTARHRTAPRRTARYRRAPRAPHRHASTARTLARLHACPHAHTEAHQSPWPQRGNARHGTAPHGDYCTHARPRLTASHAPHARTHTCMHARTHARKHVRYRTVPHAPRVPHAHMRSSLLPLRITV